MRDFPCFGCENSPAPKTVVCRECSLAPHEGDLYVFHDFCEECFKVLERNLRYLDLQEVTLPPGLLVTFSHSCPTKEFLTAKRIMT